ncbi:MAG: type III PLP-dependent enzyme [Acidimicrobiales bacterium]
MEEILSSGEEETPYLLFDLDIVRDRFQRLARSLPDAAIHYAVKANPAPEVLTLLNDLGSSFDVASPGEIVRCLGVGVDPERISYGSTIKKQRDIAWAFERGVRLFAVDSEDELRKVAESAPGSTVFCRIASDGSGADWPLTRKFGCHPDLALDLLLSAHRMGLAVGLSFHVGSQQRDPEAWDRALATVADIHAVLRANDIEPAVVNLGGGFPASYVEQVPDISVYGAAIGASLRRRLGDRRPAKVMIEPGRFLVADAGVVQAEVVLVARKSRDDTTRWVYLDVGLFGGLAEVLDEAIRYRICTPHDGGLVGPVVIAGPSCDSADVLYERSGYRLPLALRDGDRVDLLSTGAYTSTYSSVWFNGFPPLRTRYLPAR